MATYLSWPEKLHYRALFTIHVPVPLRGVFDRWPGLDETDTEAARCQQIAENKLHHRDIQSRILVPGRDPGGLVGETVGEDDILSWRYEGGYTTIIPWITKLMYVTRMLRERSAEVEGLKIPKRWTAEGGRKFVEGVRRLLEKSIEVFGMGEA